MALVVGCGVKHPPHSGVPDSPSDTAKRRFNNDVTVPAFKALIAVGVLTVENGLRWHPQTCVLLRVPAGGAWRLWGQRHAAARSVCECPRCHLAVRREIWDLMVYDPQVIDVDVIHDLLAVSNLSGNFVGLLLARTAVPLSGPGEEALHGLKSPPLLPPVNFQAMDLVNNALVGVDGKGPVIEKSNPCFLNPVGMKASCLLQISLNTVTFSSLLIERFIPLLANWHPAVVLILPVLHNRLLSEPWWEQGHGVVPEDEHRAISAIHAEVVFNLFGQTAQLILLLNKPQPSFIEVVVALTLAVADDLLLGAASPMVSTETSLSITQYLDLSIVSLEICKCGLEHGKSMVNESLIRIVCILDGGQDS